MPSLFSYTTPFRFHIKKASQLASSARGVASMKKSPTSSQMMQLTKTIGELLALCLTLLSSALDNLGNPSIFSK
jgi:hypothetical protein